MTTRPSYMWTLMESKSCGLNPARETRVIAVFDSYEAAEKTIIRIIEVEFIPLRCRSYGETEIDGKKEWHVHEEGLTFYVEKHQMIWSGKA